MVSGMQMRTSLLSVRAGACTHVRIFHDVDTVACRPSWDSKMRPHAGHKTTRLPHNHTSYIALQQTGTSIQKTEACLRQVTQVANLCQTANIFV